MWWVVGTAVWLMVLLVVVALCRAAGEADRVGERRLADRLKHAKHRSDRAA